MIRSVIKAADRERSVIMESKQESGMTVLFGLAGKNKLLIIISLLLSALSSVVGLFTYIEIWKVIKIVFDGWNNGIDTDAAVKCGIWAVVFSVGSMFINFIALIFSHKAAFGTSANMKKLAVESMMRLPIGYFRNTGSGKLRKIIEDSTAQTENFLAHLLPDIAGTIAATIMIIVLLFVFDWKMGLAVLASIIAAMLFYGKMMGRSLQEKMVKYQESLDNMNSEAVEYVRGISVVKAFQQSVFSLANFKKSIEDYKKWTLDFTYEMRIPEIGYTCSINGAYVFLIPLFILLVTNAADPTGLLLNLIFYIILCPYLVVMFAKIMSAGESTFSAMNGSVKVNEIITASKQEYGKETLASDKPLDIKLKNVSFAYPGSDEKAADDVSLDILHGKRTAFVGSSGSGKSTLASLIARFYDPDEGEIYIGGKNIRSLSFSQLNDNISVVFQHSHLIKGTIRENIAMGCRNASDKKINEAIVKAQCTDIIEKLPDGLDTMIGSEGVHLSGGEVQRLAVARAMLKDSPVILLDEATSFADPDNEVKINEAIKELTKGKTVIMIAHRLTTVKDADMIVVMESGKAKEIGTHEQLMSKNGIYSKMWQMYNSTADWKISGVDKQ